VSLKNAGAGFVRHHARALDRNAAANSIQFTWLLFLPPVLVVV
jgi:hypothetical protein